MKFVGIFMNISIEWNGRVSADQSVRIFLRTKCSSLLATLDSTKIIEVLDPDTVVFYQVHKRVWPSAQRDSCFWSHIRCIAKSEEDQPTWLVVNYTTPHPLAPVGQKNRIDFVNQFVPFDN